MGYSFAAGTTDGPGAFDFTQGEVIPIDFFEHCTQTLSSNALRGGGGGGGRGAWRFLLHH